MLIKESLLRPVLQAQPGLPENCPTANQDYSFARGFDTIGGYRETPDGKSVTCAPIRMAHNDSMNPVCKDCSVANTPILDMKTYREKLGLRF